MTKITIDTIPKKYVEFLDKIPHQIEKGGVDPTKNVFSSPVVKPILTSEVENLLGRFFSNETFALFDEPIKMHCPEAFSQKMVMGLDTSRINELLEEIQCDTQDTQEELELLKQFFSTFHELELLYQEIIVALSRIKKA